MKAKWTYKALGELGVFTRGGNFTKDDFVETGIPCIHYGQIHMKFGVRTYENLTYLPASFAAKAKYAQKGDLIIAITSEDDEGSCKCTVWLGDEKVIVGGHIAVYHHTLNPIFVSYYFRSPQFQQEKIKYTHGFKVIEIKPSDIARIPIPVPSLAEQQQIVEYLDAQYQKIDALKANAEQQLQAAKDLFQTTLKELLMPKEDGKIKRIGEIFKSYSGGTPLKSHKEYYLGGKIPWLLSGEVCRKYITHTENYITEEGMKNSSAKYFPVDTVVVAMYGATAAQVAILKKEVTSNQAICGLLPNSKYIPEYVYYWFLYNHDRFAAQAQGGAQPNLSQVKIKGMPIPVLMRSEQQAIIDKLDALSEKVNQLQENYKQTLVLCSDLKQALLKQTLE